MYKRQVLAATVSACAVDSWDPQIKPTPDYPCTAAGVVCSLTPLSCCGQGDTCGGAFPHVGCPDDSCCYIGADANFAMTSDAGAPVLKVRGKKWAPRPQP